MSNPTIEEQVKVAAFLRNIAAVAGIVVFPALTVLLYLVGDVPESKMVTVLAVPALGSVVSLIGTAFMEKLRRDSARGKHQLTEEAYANRKGVSLIEVLAFLGVTCGIIFGAVYLAVDVKKSGLAEEMATGSGAFVMESAQPVDTMVEAMHHPVDRAVLVSSTEDGPYKGVVCAINREGTLELFGFGKSRGLETFNQITMSADLKAAAPAFCDYAFAQAAAS